jgi:hypothetical protein
MNQREYFTRFDPVHILPPPRTYVSCLHELCRVCWLGSTTDYRRCSAVIFYEGWDTSEWAHVLSLDADACAGRQVVSLAGECRSLWSRALGVGSRLMHARTKCGDDISICHAYPYFSTVNHSYMSPKSAHLASCNCKRTSRIQVRPIGQRGRAIMEFGSISTWPIRALMAGDKIWHVYLSSEPNHQIKFLRKLFTVCGGKAWTAEKGRVGTTQMRSQLFQPLKI